MPLFDFHCSQCDKTVELLIRGSNPAVCPSCGNTEMQKLVSRPATPGSSAELVKSARAQARREGHFSNY
jgi:putative FmdB family regulatory protein